LKFNCIEITAFVLVAAAVLESEHLLQLLLQGIETYSTIKRKFFTLKFSRIEVIGFIIVVVVEN